MDAIDKMHYRARYYDPQTARFINEDPIGFAADGSLFKYADNDPIKNIDPFGLQSWPTNYTRVPHPWGEPRPGRSHSHDGADIEPAW